jgi:hypothetical protein
MGPRKNDINDFGMRLVENGNWIARTWGSVSTCCEWRLMWIAGKDGTNTPWIVPVFSIPRQFVDSSCRGLRFQGRIDADSEVFKIVRLTYVPTDSTNGGIWYKFVIFDNFCYRVSTLVKQ